MPRQDLAEKLDEWLKTQHGTAGWQQKLMSFIEKVEQEAYERGRKDGEAHKGQAVREAYQRGASGTHKVRS